MGDDITIGVTEIVNNIEVTAQPNDQIVDISVIDNADEVTLNITPTVIEINVNKGSSYARWGTIYGNLTDQTDLTNALILKADLVDGKVPAYQLPSFVDDVVEVANYAALPAMGEIGKIYVTLDNNKIYRWSGSIYIEIASNNAIWGAITGTLSNQTDLQNALDLKQNSLSWMSPLSVAGGTVSISYSGVSTNGALSSTDWNTFNGKANDNAVVHLTGDETISGTKTFSEDIFVNGITVGRGNGNLNSNTAFGKEALSSQDATGAGVNTAIGYGTLKNNTFGSQNTAIGVLVLSQNTTGTGNVGIGIQAIGNNTTGNNNIGISYDSLYSNTTGDDNIAIGYQAGSGNTNGSNNIIFGTSALVANQTGNNNIAIGYEAGRYTNSGGSNTTSNGSIYIGAGTVPNSNNQTNQIVIGLGAVGAGSNTVTIGNTSITTTRLRGEVQGGSFKKDGGTSSQFLKADGSVDSTTYATDSNVVHKTGAETITGKKTFDSSAGSSDAIEIISNSTGKAINISHPSGGTAIFIDNPVGTGLNVNNIGTNSFGIAISNPNTGRAISMSNSSSGTGIWCDNVGTGTGIYSYNSTSGYGIRSLNQSTGTGFYSVNESTGIGFNSNNSSTGKGFESTNSSTGQGFYSLNSGLGTGIYSTNTAAGKGIESYNSSTGIGFYSGNTGTGTALYLNNQSSGKNLVLMNTTSATGMPFTIQKQGLDVFTINDAGVATANSFINVNTSTGYGISVTNTGGGVGIYSNNTSGTGFLSVNNSNFIGIESINYGTNAGIRSRNDSTGRGIESQNISTGYGIYSTNTGNGRGIFCENTSTGIGVFLSNSGSGKNLLLNNTAPATGMPFTVQKGGVDKFTINDAGGVYAAGSVGIGTTSPSSLLHLKTSGSTAQSIESTGSANYASLGFLNTTTGYGYDIGFGGSSSIAPNSFYIYGGSSASVKFLINSGGNVGIGTTSPDELLD